MINVQMGWVSILFSPGNPDQPLLGLALSPDHVPGSHFSSAWSCGSLLQERHKSAGLQPYSQLISAPSWDFLI